MELFVGSAGSEGHHLRAAEDRLRRGVRAQQQWQHREAQVHVHSRLQEAGLHRTFAPLTASNSAVIRFVLKKSKPVSPASRSPPQNHVNPAVDFTQIPPGMLALDNMLYFARHHQDAYIRVSVRLPHQENALHPADLVFLPVLDSLTSIIALWLAKCRDCSVFWCVLQSCPALA